jgi:hypothetical protein
MLTAPFERWLIGDCIMVLQTLDQRTDAMHAACDALGTAVDEGSLGEIVKRNQHLIFQYYDDVLNHVRKSFRIAQWAAIGGFVIFLLTILYVFVVDWLYVSEGLGVTKQLVDSKSDVDFAKLNIIANELQTISQAKHYSMITVASLGAISGFIVQFFAAVAFYLYQKVADQFSAFHICLERTHRYLVAYKIVEQIKANKDEALHDLICIMANAPMITRADITSKNDKELTAKLHQLALPRKEHGAQDTWRFQAASSA